MPWNPPAQPRWVEAMNALAANLGDDGRSLVPLDAQSLLSSAAANTGLDDFGDDWFREPFQVLLTALEDEARLTLVGRILARAEIQRVLQNRLRVEDRWKRHPEILRERIEAPIVVTGLGRSGTTLLHDLLAQDPANRVPLQWELMDSVSDDSRIAAIEREIVVMDECDPSFPTMHEMGATFPTECIYIFAHQFASDMFTGEFNVPSYTVWNATHDLTPAYAYHKRFLQLLQWRHRGARWVLKAPSYISKLRLLFATYPDARVVIAHRDPLRVIGSLANLIATLKRMRTDHVNFEQDVATMACGFAYLVNQLLETRRSGVLPEEQVTDVRYSDLVADPVGVVRRLYDHWGIPWSGEMEARIRAHLASRGHGEGRATHRYRFADTGLDREEQRAQFVDYMAAYEIPIEV